MLKHRVITALILIPLVVAAILFLEHRYFAALLGVVLLLGAWEWSAMAGLGGRIQRGVVVAFTALILALLSYFIHEDQPTLIAILVMALAWWAFDVFWVVLANIKGVDAVAFRRLPGGRGLNLVVGWVILCGLFVALVGLRQSETHGPYFVLFLLILMWVADSGAYFVGRRFGRHKLAARVSPGKSWEGVAGAALGTLLVSWLGGSYFNVSGGEQIVLLLVCLITVAFSILGDLTESLFKRQANMKDSGHLLPGHGGILDRIDSLTAAAPVFFAGLMMARLP